MTVTTIDDVSSARYGLRCRTQAQLTEVVWAGHLVSADRANIPPRCEHAFKEKNQRASKPLICPKSSAVNVPLACRSRRPPSSTL